MAPLALLGLSLTVLGGTVLVGCAPPRQAAAPSGRLAAVRERNDRPPRRAVVPEGPSAPAPGEAADPRRAAAGGLLDRANLARSEGRPADAAELLERAVVVDPTFPATYVQLARLHIDEGEPRLALGFLDKAEALAARDRDALAEIAALRGATLEELGDRDGARAAYRRALSLVPGHGRARAGWVRTGGDAR
jgi:tetratricopeptide (TPR) repeat protein